MTEYEPDVGLNEAIKTVMSDRKYAEFKILNDRSIVVQAFLKVTTDNDGEHKPCKGCPVKVQKVSDLHRAAGITADYIILVDYYAWNHPKGVDPAQTQEAMLHYALKGIKIEVKDGKVKKGKNEPDIVTYGDTALRYPDVVRDLTALLEPASSHSKRLAIGAGEPAHIEEAPAADTTQDDSGAEEPVEEAPRVRRGGRK